MLRNPERLHEAYGHMRATLSGGGGSGGTDDGADSGSADVPQEAEGAAARLSRLFQKSFCERTTWLNVVHALERWP